MGLLDNISKVASSLNPVVGIANAVSSIANGFFDRHAQKESNKRNAEQNELNREFNAQEAEKNRKFQSAESAKQNAFNAAQAQLAFDRSAKFQQEMWQKENEYNTPLAQIKRLEEAGINPNMFGGDNTAGSAGSAVSPAASGSAPSGSAASVGSSIPNQPISYVNPLLEAAQIRLANATAEKAEQDAERVKKLLPGEIVSQNMNLRLGEKSLEMSDSQISEIKSRMDVQASQLKNLDAQTSKIAKENDLLSLDEKQRGVLLKYYEDELVADLMHKQKQLGIDDATIKHIASQIALNYENQILVGSQTSLNYDAHLLNGIQLQYAGKMAKLTYDSSKNQYDIDVLRGVTEKRQAGKRSVDSWLNHTFDTLDLITNTVGNVFGNVPQYLYKR